MRQSRSILRVVVADGEATNDGSMASSDRRVFWQRFVDRRVLQKDWDLPGEFFVLAKHVLEWCIVGVAGGAAAAIVR